MLFLASGTGICVGGLTWLIKTYIFPESNEVQSIQEAIPIEAIPDVVGLPDKQVNRLIPFAPDSTNEVSNPIQSDEPDLSQTGEAPDLSPVQSDLSQSLDDSDEGDESNESNAPDLSPVHPDLSQPLDSGEGDSGEGDIDESNEPDLSQPQVSIQPVQPDLQTGGSRKLFISKIKSRKRVNKCKYCKNT